MSGRRELHRPSMGNTDLNRKDFNFLEPFVSGRRELLSRRRNPPQGETRAWNQKTPPK